MPTSRSAWPDPAAKRSTVHPSLPATERMGSVSGHAPAQSHGAGPEPSPPGSTCLSVAWAAGPRRGDRRARFRALPVCLGGAVRVARRPYRAQTNGPKSSARSATRATISPTDGPSSTTPISISSGDVGWMTSPTCGCTGPPASVLATDSIATSASSCSRSRYGPTRRSCSPTHRPGRDPHRRHARSSRWTAVGGLCSRLAA